ncbi:Uu.00g121830.m01.CDS01 [Anthostomella pinea]|uniref:Uu.00g121830.m01.CDS01 n=1 Tax=Anthostomella pinea TaxID=933095 RepID=A0AAI8VH04_9PEZI|nr:Uu.00g121830.m01.CDS01 [Anthostomella pinea]
MRFGADFYRYQIPDWHRYYISYNELKALIKLNAGRDDYHVNLKEIESSIEKQVNKLESFQQRKLDWFGRQESDVCARVAPTQRPLTPADIADIDYQTLQLLLHDYDELRQHHGQLLWFGRVNEEAARRLTLKLKKLELSSDPSYRQVYQKATSLLSRVVPDDSCAATHRRLSTLVTAINISLESHEPRQILPRLDADTLRSIHPGVSLEDWKLALHDDEPSSIAEAFQPAIELQAHSNSYSLDGIAHQLLRDSVSHQANRITRWLLTDLFPRCDLGVDFDCLVLFLRVFEGEGSVATQQEGSQGEYLDSSNTSD